MFSAARSALTESLLSNVRECKCFMRNAVSVSILRQVSVIPMLLHDLVPRNWQQNYRIYSN